MEQNGVSKYDRILIFEQMLYYGLMTAIADIVCSYKYVTLELYFVNEHDVIRRAGPTGEILPRMN